MIPVIIEEKKINLPSTWQEVTLGQYIDMINYRDELNTIRLLSIMSGVSYAKLMNIDESKFDYRIMEAMDFLLTPIDVYELKDVESITINGKEINIPDPSKCTIGQKLLMQQMTRVAQVQETLHAELIATSCAIYLQPVIDNKPFDDSRLEEIKKIVYTLPLVEIYPVGSFFLNGWLRFLKSSSQPLQTTQPTKSLGRDVPLFSLNFMNLTLLSNLLIMTLQNSMLC